MKTDTKFLILAIVLISGSYETRADDELPTTRTLDTSNKPSKKLKVSDNIDLPSGCTYLPTIVTCFNLTTTPDLKKFTNATEIYINSGQIEVFNFTQMPLNNLIKLDLSKNRIKIFDNPAKKSVQIQKLVDLNLKENKIENLGAFLAWNFTILKELDLSFNPIGELGATAFNKTAQLRTLRLAATNLTSIHETTFWPLTQLERLDISGADIVNHYSSKQFLKNQKLKSLDLSNNRLVEVPAAIRATSSIQNLTLNGNKMTSLRQSDFINQSAIEYLEVKGCAKLTKIDEHTFGEMFDLKELIISNNDKLNYISKDAFQLEKSSNDEVKMLSLLDLSSNNITTMSNPKEFTSLNFTNIRLNSNPWHCTCELEWFITLPLQERDSVHCKSPQEYKDLELSQYLMTVDCEAEQSSYHRLIVTIFLVFLFGLAVAVFVQKSEFCRRVFWKDQYGTIYYTKASFPPENA